MKTSYYSKAVKLKGQNLVSIAKWKPNFIKCREYTKLAPTISIFSKYKNGKYKSEERKEAEYTKAYKKEILGKLDPQEVYDELGEDAILLCWEGKDKFCHRHLVAEWLEENLNIEIKEID